MLGTPPAFVLSQDQTLMFNPLSFSLKSSINSSYWLSFAFLVSVSFSRFGALSSAVLSSELVHNNTVLLGCQHLFWNFFRFFWSFLYSRTFTKLSTHYIWYYTNIAYNTHQIIHYFPSVLPFPFLHQSKELHKMLLVFDWLAQEDCDIKSYSPFCFEK